MRKLPEAVQLSYTSSFRPIVSVIVLGESSGRSGSSMYLSFWNEKPLTVSRPLPHSIPTIVTTRLSFHQLHSLSQQRYILPMQYESSEIVQLCHRFQQFVSGVYAFSKINTNTSWVPTRHVTLGSLNACQAVTSLLCGRSKRKTPTSKTSCANREHIALLAGLKQAW